MIKIKGLSYAVNGKKILKNIDVEIRKNHITGVLGPNGCGKTTLLRHIIRELPSRDKIYIEGTKIEKIPRREFARKVSFVEQSNVGIEEFTIEDIVKTGRHPYKRLFFDYTSEDKKILEKVLKLFELEELRNKKAGKVSGGELKRAFIAKAFAQNTEIMLLDEPVNHLDIKHQLELMKLLKEMKAKTIIFSIHNIDLALKFCDDIILMKDGEIKAYGTVKKILTSENIRKIFEVESSIKNIDNENIIVYK